jgi:hypothetical protein
VRHEEIPQSLLPGDRFEFPEHRRLLPTTIADLLVKDGLSRVDVITQEVGEAAV